jgi:hypothetical protein
MGEGVVSRIPPWRLAGVGADRLKAERVVCGSIMNRYTRARMLVRVPLLPNERSLAPDGKAGNPARYCHGGSLFNLAEHASSLADHLNHSVRRT